MALKQPRVMQHVEVDRFALWRCLRADTRRTMVRGIQRFVRLMPGTCRDARWRPDVWVPMSYGLV